MFQTYKVRFKADSRQIMYINSILDSYEGVGIMRTIDSRHGLAAIYSTEKLHSQVLKILDSIKSEGIYIYDISVSIEESVDSW